MSLNLDPLEWEWVPITQGDTYPAINITETLADTDLVRVRLKVKDSNGNILLSLDSDIAGITINVATAGAWDFTIDEMPEETTAAIIAGTHRYDMEFTYDSGTVRTEFAGDWQIHTQISD